MLQRKLFRITPVPSSDHRRPWHDHPHRRRVVEGPEAGPVPGDRRARGRPESEHDSGQTHDCASLQREDLEEPIDLRAWRTEPLFDGIGRRQNREHRRLNSELQEHAGDDERVGVEGRARDGKPGQCDGVSQQLPGA